MSDTEKISAVSESREGEEEQVNRGGSYVQSVRGRVMTEKGREYEITKTRRRADSFKSKWNHVTTRIMKSLKTIANPFDLQSLLREEGELYDQYIAEYAKLVELEHKGLRR